ncbi:tyrosine-type recombinase/integrase [Clostridium tyrobutyricum]|uniref:tyrosine-type recombinase/integrase n=1 Tax=Clostridium tyrobutyricum TaxID=1519 RepID=UPI001C392CC8|nr:site-specific integrase [Clostridium tyrobutyricum]MBV4422958.1 site-specific integrase [Clostridium tyrobutyricum]
MKGTIRKSINKDGKATYSYLVYIGIDENGKKKYKRKRGFKKKKECETALAELISQIEKGSVVTNEKMSVRDYINYWLETYPKSNCQPSTYKRYQFFANDIIKYLGNTKLSKLNPLLIQKFYEDLKSDRQISNNTIIKTHRMFHLALKHAQKWQLIYVNPCDLVTPPSSEPIEMKYWEPDEINMYLNLLEDDFLYPMIYLAVHTGLREGEICALKWEDFDPIEKTITVNKTLQRIGGTLKTKRTKTQKSTRIVTLFDTTYKFLKSLKNKDMSIKLEKGIDLNYIFHWEDGRPIDPNYISKKFPEALTSRKIPKIRFHDLRHTHATLLRKLNVNPKVISERLGHTDVAFTLKTYTHVSTKMQREEIAKAENFL